MVKICQFDSPAIQTLQYVICTAGWPRHNRWFLSDRFCFPFQSWSGLSASSHTLLPSGDWGQMLQWIKAIWFASPPYSLAYNSPIGTHTRNKRHPENIWKGNSGFRWPQLLFSSNNKSVQRIKASGTGSTKDYTARLLWQVELYMLASLLLR